MTVSPAVKVAKNGHEPNLDEPIKLTTGYTVRLKPIPPMAIEEAQANIIDPAVPKQEIEGKDGLFDNPQDPTYLTALKKAERDRVQAAFDVMVLFGIELVDGLPMTDDWLDKLRFMSKRGQIDLEGYDLNNPLEKEFVFKKFIVMGNQDWVLLSEISGVSAEEIAQARSSFQG